VFEFFLQKKLEKVSKSEAVCFPKFLYNRLKIFADIILFDFGFEKLLLSLYRLFFKAFFNLIL